MSKFVKYCCILVSAILAVALVILGAGGAQAADPDYTEVTGVPSDLEDERNLTERSLMESKLLDFPRVGVVGDSITAGQAATTPFPTVAGMQSVGYPGRCIMKRCWAWQAMIGNMDIAIDGAPAYGVPGMTPRPTYVVVELGTNDILTGSKAPRIKAGLTLLREEIIEMGMRPVLTTIVPTAKTVEGYKIQKAQRDRVNSWIRGSGYSYIDLDKKLRGTSGALPAKYDSGDGIHPNQAAHDAMASALVRWANTHASS